MFISWPTNYASGFSLKASATLGPGASWNAASPLAVLVGNQWVETNTISSGSRFFRLSSP